MCKGADSVIAELLSKESLKSIAYNRTSKFVNDYAKEGLRTLFLAEKILDEDYYN
jgi:magnesium-transporting ATPase (P-type)